MDRQIDANGSHSHLTFNVIMPCPKFLLLSVWTAIRDDEHGTSSYLVTSLKFFFVFCCWRSSRLIRDGPHHKITALGILKKLFKNMYGFWPVISCGCCISEKKPEVAQHSFTSTKPLMKGHTVTFKVSGWVRLHSLHPFQQSTLVSFDHE